MSLPEWLDHIDKVLFTLIQHDSDHAVLDVVMPVLRDPYTWIPFYAFMLCFVLLKDRRHAWMFIVLSLLTFAVTDSLTAQVMKPLFGRLRPCYDPALTQTIRVLVDCSGFYSMPSSHAANHFGLAAFWYYAILSMTGKKWRGLYVWAAAIGYAQVYVGKHYPFDVLIGSFTGLLAGVGMSRIFIYLWDRRSDRRSGFIGWFKKVPGNTN